MDNKKEIQLEELKSIEKNILCVFDLFCKENGIRYSLSGGTLIGAIRHKGFIPWDDDVDIMMNRDEYNRFIELYQKQNRNSRYKLITYETKNYNYMFAKLVDTSTVLIEDYNKPVEDMGVYIDLFPIDSLGNTYEEARKRLRANKFKLYLTVASNWRKFYINKSRSFLRQIPRAIFYILSRGICANKIFKNIEKRFEFNNEDKFFGCVCGVYEDKEIMDSSIFKEYIYVEFEGKPFMVTKNYDEYLTGIYGDYMQLPPVEKQVTHHTFKAYKKEEE